jgi:type I restriction enzyme S subunit
MYNIENGRIVLKNVRLMRLSESEIDDYILLPGDVLINRVNSRELVGKAAVIPASLGPAVFESKNIRLRMWPDSISPQYVCYFLMTRPARDQIEMEAKQTVGMATISQSEIDIWRIPLAPRGEQRRIVARIEALFAQADAVEAAVARGLRRVEQFEQSVLARAFRGELV